MPLHDQVDHIESREQFIEFVHALWHDFCANSAEWSNDNLNSYLEAAAAWSADMDGYFEGRGESASDVPPWRLLGMILLAAKYYE